MMAEYYSYEDPVAWREKAIEAAGWALCAYAKGAGPGRCDPKDCCCHHEARIAVEAYEEAFRVLSACAADRSAKPDGELGSPLSRGYSG